MLRLPTAVLVHHTSVGSHHDWLVANPRDATARLWTARVAAPPSAWAHIGGALMFTTLPPHRRAYLRYQGPISGGRGRVIRIDRGWAVAHLWADHRIDLTLHLTSCAGRLILRRTAPNHWLGQWCRG